MPSLPEQQAGDAVTYTITLLRAAAKESQDVLALLEELEQELAGQILALPDDTVIEKKRLQKLLDQASAAIASTYSEIADGQQASLEGFATAAADQFAYSLNKAIGVDVFAELLSAPTIKQLVKEPVVLGHSAASWWTGQEAALRNRFVQQMQLGQGLGETNDRLAQRIRGTKAKGYTDGIMKTSRREALSLVRTSAMSVSNAARLETFKEHDDLIQAIQWLATLDSRTTLICRALDGKRWSLPDYKPLGHDKAFPGQTAHFQCRSTQIGTTPTWSELAGRPIKALDRRTLQDAIEDRLREEGADEKAIAAAIATARASIDGPVPDSYDMQKWIKHKGSDYAEQILGPGRAALFTAGKITVTDLTDQNNRPLTIVELHLLARTGTTPPETLGRAYNPAPGDSKAALRAKARAASAELEKMKAGEKK